EAHLNQRETATGPWRKPTQPELRLPRIDETVGAGEFTDQGQISFQEIEAGKLGEFRPGDLREIQIDYIAAKPGHRKKSQLHLDDAGVDVVIAGKLFSGGYLD